MRIVLAVGLASALGGLCRDGIGGAIARRNSSAFPWETFLVNTTGAFVLGLLFVVSTESATRSPPG